MTLLVRRISRRIVAVAVFVTATGCVGEPQEGDADAGADTDTAVAATVTYEADIRPILERTCQACHVAGGAGPFPLTNFDEVEPLAGAVVGVVAAREMPPQPDDPVCDEVDCPPGLSDDEIALFETWADEGFAKGEPPPRP